MPITQLKPVAKAAEIQDQGPIGPQQLAQDGTIVLLDENGDVAGVFTSIQAAVDASSNGYTLVVGAGTYTEQVTVNDIDDLTIRADTGDTVVIKAPATLGVNGVSDYFGDNVRANLAVNDSTGFSLEGIDIDGSFAGDTTAGSNGDEITGIALLNSSGSIDDVDIFDVSNSVGGGLFGLQHGSGLLVDGTGLAGEPAVSITNTTISDFQKTGALIIGTDITFTGNTITGIGGTNLTAQNGIQIALSTGTLSGNTISEFGYSGGGVYSSGVIAYEPSGALAISGNTITGAGALGSSAGIDLSDVLGIEVDLTGNSFDSLDYGIYAYTYTGGAVGLDADPDTGGNTYTNILVEGVHFDPEESYGAPFTTTTAFTEAGSGFTDLLAGSDGDDLFSGLGGADVLLGRGGDDTLDGGAGSDEMSGGVGDDAYYVDVLGDLVTEAAGEGRDVVYAYGTFGLSAGSHVEVLSTASLIGTDPIGLYGNELAQEILGNAGANAIRGGGGADTLVGFGGNDEYYVGDAAEEVRESSGEGRDAVYASVDYVLRAGSSVEVLSTDSLVGTSAIDLTGNELTQEVFGNAGANILDGKAGADYLFGGSGADTFAFTTALGGGNVDAIADFSVADDVIALDDAVFTGLTPGALAPGAFVTGTSAQDADDRIIYDAATGQLYYDADGNGAGAQVLFATLNGAPALTASDFFVI